MKKLISKLKIPPHVLTVVFVLMFFFANSLNLTQAQTASTPVTPPDFAAAAQSSENDLTNNLCEPYMADYSSKELANFRSFLDTNFQNKSSTGSLLPIAIGKYRELRDELYGAYNKYYPNQGTSLLVTGLQPGRCEQIILDTLNDAKTLLKTHAMQTSNVKKATALIEKYQQINAQLSDLYQNFVYMKAYLNTFAGKLPCYPKKGCVKG